MTFPRAPEPIWSDAKACAEAIQSSTDEETRLYWRMCVRSKLIELKDALFVRGRKAWCACCNGIAPICCGDNHEAYCIHCCGPHPRFRPERTYAPVGD